MPADHTIADVPAAILAGGLATRLRPITTTIPKAMVEVAGRPFIAHQLDLLRENGVRRVVLCLGYLGEQIEQYLGDGAAFGMELRYSHDGDRLLGTGGACDAPCRCSDRSSGCCTATPIWMSITGRS